MNTAIEYFYDRSLVDCIAAGNIKKKEPLLQQFFTWYINGGM